MYFWGQKYQKPPHVVFRGSARTAALHGARKIKPMCHPVADAPQPAPSFSASNESADSWCRHGRHRVKYQFTPTASFHLLFLESVFLFSARRFPTWFRWRKSGRRAESDSGGDGLLANPRIVARRRFQTSGRRHRNRSGGFCCFSPPKSREKRKSFPQEDRKSQKVFERTFAAAFRHRKAEKKKRRGTKTHLRTGKSADHGCRPRRRYNKREKTDCRQGPGLRQRATPLPRSPATRGDAQRSGRHTNTPARCAAPVCGSPPVRPA